MKIAVIGAGIGGMAAAFDLSQAGHQVTIYDANGYVGGLASGFKKEHWFWTVERYYHHWFQTDKYMLGLIKELGLESKVIFPRPYTVMYHQGSFYPFDSISAAIRFPGLGWGLNKVRFGLVGLFLRLSNNWKALETVTAENWLIKWAGKNTYQTMWEPLLIGKFGPYFRDINMAWMWARIKARTTRLGTYQGGFQEFADDFSGCLTELGVKLSLNETIRQIIPNSKAGIDIQNQGGIESFDQCLVTTSPQILSKLTPSLPPEYTQGLKDMKSMGAVVLILALKNRLSKQGYYWYNIPKSAGFPFLALVEHTNFVSPANFGGDHIVYCGDYLDAEHEYFSLDKEALLQRFLPSMSRFNPDFHPDWVMDSWLFKTKYAQPVPFLNHSKNIPAIETPIPGLFFASMSQVYPWDRGTNFAVAIGRRAAGIMCRGVNHAS